MVAPWRSDPLLQDVEHASRLSGLSGTCVYLVSKDGQRWFVRKCAADEAGGERLQRQIAKQRAFGESVDELRVPGILDEGIREGRYFADMQFIRGWDAASFLRNADYDAVRRFTEVLATYIATAAKAPPAIPAQGDFFLSLYRKLASVQRKTAGLSCPALANLFLAIERMADLQLEPTLCHGDLTFDNLLVARGEGAPKLWVVDLLDAPYEHYWNDVGKLHQDLAGGWYLRSQPRVARGVTEFVSRHVLQRVAQIDERYLQVHDAMVGITFARILPYVTNEAQRQFVRQRVEYFAERAGRTMNRGRPD